MNNFHLPSSYILLLLLSMTSSLATAESLPDPTRPPVEIIAPAGGGQRDEQFANAAEGRGLQVVMIAPDRRTAIINGRTVKVGEKYGNATLIEIQEGAVVLRDARGRKTSLTMFPGVGIKKKETPSSQQDNSKTDITEKQEVEKAAPQAAPQEEK